MIRANSMAGCYHPRCPWGKVVPGSAKWRDRATGPVGTLAVPGSACSVQRPLFRIGTLTPHPHQPMNRYAVSCPL